MEQKISELDKDMNEWIKAQNEWVKGHLAPESQNKYDTTKGKIYLLQGIIDKHLYKKDQTSELQALGICFGEILCMELELHWVIVEDEYGRDPALRYKSTSIIHFPRTMISKRIENNEKVSISDLLKNAIKTQKELIEKGY
jgi:hypothetical protein